MNLLTPQEAAARLRVSRNLVYRLCQERRLTHVRAGARGRRGRILIDEAALTDLVESLCVAATESVDGAGDPPPLKYIRLS